MLDRDVPGNKLLASFSSYLRARSARYRASGFASAGEPALVARLLLWLTNAMCEVTKKRFP